MKQFLIPIAIAVAVASPVLAQGGQKGNKGQGGQGGERGQRGQGGQRGMRNPMARLIRELDLNADQKTKVEKIMDAYNEKRQALEKETREGVEKILTADQKKKLEELMKQARERRGEGGPGGPGGQGGRPQRP
ncbi:MAG: hypothetical protein ACKO5K_06235 [Armatimonadota bacterium]